MRHCAPNRIVSHRFTFEVSVESLFKCVLYTKWTKQRCVCMCLCTGFDLNEKNYVVLESAYWLCRFSHVPFFHTCLSICERCFCFTFLLHIWGAIELRSRLSKAMARNHFAHPIIIIDSKITIMLFNLFSTTQSTCSTIIILSLSLCFPFWFLMIDNRSVFWSNKSKF